MNQVHLTEKNVTDVHMEKRWIDKWTIRWVKKNTPPTVWGIKIW